MSDNPWLERRVLNYAHQGGAAEAPSSTLFALRRAVEAGADALELDVHATLDRVLVVCHDATLDATTNGSGAIADLTIAEIRALDNAFHFHLDDDEGVHPYRGRAPSDHEFGVATLEEVLQAFPDVFLNLDIKATAPEVVPYEADLAAMLRRYGRSDDVIVASFLDVATDAFSKVAPEIHTSAGTMATAGFYFALRDGTEIPVTAHVAFQVPSQAAGVELVTVEFVERAHEAGKAVHVWTINEVEEMEHLLDLGVDGIMTDRPTLLESRLQQRGLAYASR